MNQLRMTRLAYVFLIVLVAAFLKIEVVRAELPLNCGSWKVVSSPNPVGAGAIFLNGVAAVSANDIWAVGGYQNPVNYQTLIEHWDGTKWSIVASPNPGTSNDNLLGVSAVSANNIWAVGDYTDPGFPQQTLIEHWNGTKWKVVPSQNAGMSSNVLNGVAAISANNIWAVGSDGNGETLTEHWNGSLWSIVPSVNNGTGATLNAVTQVPGTSKLWAVGISTGGSILAQTLIERWNGTKWSISLSQNPSSSTNDLKGVAAASAKDVWAVGIYAVTVNGPDLTLIEHWNGTKWSVVPGANPGMNSDSLSGVAAVSANNVWAVGQYVDSSNNLKTLIEHWDGIKWSVVSSPNPGSQNSLDAITLVPHTSQAWAVGSYSNGSPNQTLTEFYC